MREFTKVSPLVWRSECFSALPDSESKLFYLYLLTCPHVNSIGCFVMPIGYAADDLSVDNSDIRYRIDTVSKAGLILHDDKSKTFFIRNWYRFNPPCNKKHAKHMAIELQKVSNIPFKQDVIKEFQETCLEKNIASSDEFKIPYLDPIDTVSINRDLTLPLPNLTETSNLKGNPPELEPNVPRETRMLSEGACGEEKYLWEEFLGCKTVEDFIENMPVPWQGALETHVKEEIEGMRLAFCHTFWNKYVGSYPGDKVADKYPKTQNWFWRWQHQAEEYARKAQKLPPRRVIGSKVKERISGLISGNAA